MAIAVYVSINRNVDINNGAAISISAGTTLPELRLRRLTWVRAHCAPPSLSLH